MDRFLDPVACETFWFHPSGYGRIDTIACLCLSNEGVESVFDTRVFRAEVPCPSIAMVLRIDAYVYTVCI